MACGGDDDLVPGLPRDPLHQGQRDGAVGGRLSQVCPGDRNGNTWRNRFHWTMTGTLRWGLLVIAFLQDIHLKWLYYLTVIMWRNDVSILVFYYRMKVVSEYIIFLFSTVVGCHMRLSYETRCLMFQCRTLITLCVTWHNEVKWVNKVTKVKVQT